MLAPWLRPARRYTPGRAGHNKSWIPCGVRVCTLLQACRRSPDLLLHHAQALRPALVA